MEASSWGTHGSGPLSPDLRSIWSSDGIPQHYEYRHAGPSTAPALPARGGGGWHWDPRSAVGPPAPCAPGPPHHASHHASHHPGHPHHPDGCDGGGYLLPQPGLSTKTKVCRYYLARTQNHYGRSCGYVHPCRNMLISGSCSHGRRCTDDHVCRAFIFYGDGGPQGCSLGHTCRNIHVKQEADRAALIDMYRDWIAVRAHEQVAAATLGSAAVAASVVQTEVMLAAVSMTTPSARVHCPFWYTDTMAGCKAGPECVYDHPGQFQLPTRPMTSPTQVRFAERAWEKRRAGDATAASTSPSALSVLAGGGGSGFTTTSGGSSSSASTLSITASPFLLPPGAGDAGALSPTRLCLSDGHGSLASSALRHASQHHHTPHLHHQLHQPHSDMSTLLSPSAVISQALQMATLISGPASTASSSSSPFHSSGGGSPRHPGGSSRQSQSSGHSHGGGGKRRGTPPHRSGDSAPVPGTLGADLLLPSSGAYGHYPPPSSQTSGLGLMGMGEGKASGSGTSLRSALAGLAL